MASVENRVVRQRLIHIDLTPGLHATIQKARIVLARLFVEPDVFHAPAVEDAIDHDRPPLDQKSFHTIFVALRSGVLCSCQRSQRPNFFAEIQGKHP